MLCKFSLTRPKLVDMLRNAHIRIQIRKATSNKEYAALDCSKTAAVFLRKQVHSYFERLAICWLKRSALRCSYSNLSLVRLGSAKARAAPRIPSSRAPDGQPETQMASYPPATRRSEHRKRLTFMSNTSIIIKMI